MLPATIARTIINANERLSATTEQRLGLPNDKQLWRTFELEVHERIRALPDGATIIDLGGGRRCVYHHALRPELTLVAVDISTEELALNPHATRTVVADASEGLPLPDASVDLLVSRAVLEHVPDVRAAARHMARVLKPGATTMHFLPGRNGAFAVAARLLPFKPLLKLLHRVMPDSVDQVEFDVFYDQGTPHAIERAFRDAGFRDIHVEVTWAQGYFASIYPLFVLHAVYEVVVRRLRIKRLATYMIVRASR